MYEVSSWFLLVLMESLFYFLSIDQVMYQGERI
jgi:hypothetical protein